MINIQDLDVKELENLKENIKTVKNNKKLTYYNIECSFDIETNSTYHNGDKVAFMYIWAFGISDLKIYGRTWEEFQSLMEIISDIFELEKDKRILCYIHNFSFEFQFMRKYFKWTEVFAISERKPIKALTSLGIEFRDSYILSGFSLAKTAENLANHTIEKMTGDLDYSLLRTKDTPLSEEEMKYVENDIVIILYYINEQIEQYGDLHKVPLTNTGRVRKYVERNCYYTNTNHRKSSRGKYHRYRKLMQSLTLTTSDYMIAKQSFQGGFTHANSHYTGQTLENVTSIDFTSSYPAVMLAELFPMSKAEYVKVKDTDHFLELLKTYHVIFEATFTNIQTTIEQENYLSESKCRHIENSIINNGRVFRADKLTTTITEIDFSIIRKAYNWDSFNISNVHIFQKGYLPKSIIESVLELYKDKTELKGVEGKEVEYGLAKGMLNSVYGMSVTDIVRDETEYINDEWESTPPLIGNEIEKYNDKKNRFLFYIWGVYITAYARRNLWTGILNIGDDYVYSDTDSIKLLNYEKHLPYIEKYNEVIIKKMELMCEYYTLDVNDLKPKNIQGIEKPIGVWDYEGTSEKFKTLGAKRYLTLTDNKLELTVAGLSKKNGLEYMVEQCGGNYHKVFDYFNDELYIPAERTGKMTHTYIDESITFIATDYLGNSTEVTTHSGVHLESVDFTLSLSKQYANFIKQVMNGYLYVGKQL